MKKRSGLALVTVLGVFLILNLLVIALLQAMAGYIGTTQTVIKRIKASYLAEAGINDAMMKLFLRTWAVPLTGDVNYTLSIDTPDGQKQVNVTIQRGTGGSLPYRITASANP